MSLKATHLCFNGDLDTRRQEQPIDISGISNPRSKSGSNLPSAADLLDENTKFVEDFVQNLVDRMKKEDLEFENKTCNKTFCLTAAAASAKYNILLDIPCSQGRMSVHMGVLFRKHDIVKYIYDASYMMIGDSWTCQNQGWVLLKCVEVVICFGSGKDNMKICVPLYEASIRGDWQAARVMLDQHLELA